MARADELLSGARSAARRFAASGKGAADLMIAFEALDAVLSTCQVPLPEDWRPAPSNDGPTYSLEEVRGDGWPEGSRFVLLGGEA